jgi:hypothetical protein
MALFCMAAGAVAAIALAGRLIPRLGSAVVVRVSALVFLTAVVLPLLASNLVLLIPALVLLGAGNGAMDVSMNAQAVLVEKRLGRPIMSTLHGTWSVGGLAGAACATLAATLGLAPLAYVVLASTMLGILAVAAFRGLVPRADDPTTAGPLVARPTGVLLALGVMAALALVAEGAIGDWSGVYLRLSLDAAPELAAVGFAAFSGAMAAGRFAGDRLVARFGAVRVVRTSALVGACGLGTALLVGRPLVAVVGCAAVGVGLANLIPILFRAAGSVPGIPAGTGLAAVASAGYAGFLAGPPLIGLAAEAITLPGALGLVAASVGGLALGARVTGAVDGRVESWHKAAPWDSSTSSRAPARSASATPRPTSPSPTGPGKPFA